MHLLLEEVVPTFQVPIWYEVLEVERFMCLPMLDYLGVEVDVVLYEFIFIFSMTIALFPLKSSTIPGLRFPPVVLGKSCFKYFRSLVFVGEMSDGWLITL